MSDDPIQRAALTAVLIGIASTNISNFLVGVLNSNGLANRLDILLLIMVIWIVFFLVFSKSIKAISVFEAKRPRFVAFLRRVIYITNFAAGVFVSLYFSSFVNQMNFLSFNITEVIILVAGAIIFLAILQLMLEQFTASTDTRLENHRSR